MHQWQFVSDREFFYYLTFNSYSIKHKTSKKPSKLIICLWILLWCIDTCFLCGSGPLTFTLTPSPLLPLQILLYLSSWINISLAVKYSCAHSEADRATLPLQHWSKGVCVVLVRDRRCKRTPSSKETPLHPGLALQLFSYPQGYSGQTPREIVYHVAFSAAQY